MPFLLVFKKLQVIGQQHVSQHVVDLALVLISAAIGESTPAFSRGIEYNKIRHSHKYSFSKNL